MVWLWLIPICYFADMLIRYCGFTNTLRIELNLVAKHMLNPSTSSSYLTKFPEANLPQAVRLVAQITTLVYSISMVNARL